MTIEKEKRVELVCLLASGLLASGHYTRVKQDGNPEMKEQEDDATAWAATWEAFHLLQDIIDRIDPEEE